MLCLALDTSSSITAVALLRDERVLAEDDSPAEQKHAETLLPRVQAVLKGGGCSLQQLDLIAVGVGPGSFTGLRVGLATAKGLALSLGTPIRGVSSLSVLARGLSQAPGAAARPLLTVLDAHKGEVFVAGFELAADGALRQTLEAFHATPEQASERLRNAIAAPVVCGDGARRYAEQLLPALPGCELVDAAFDAPRGRHVAAEAARLLRIEGPSELSTLEPSYLRGSDARLPDQPLRVS
jgi:tRNA threonylcarbamoyladenosine biosynthesis protein TsaB